MISRRMFLSGLALSIGASDSVLAADKESRTTQKDPLGFFTLARKDGRWWFLTPERKLFFSLGLNHIDSASLRYPENIDIWRNRYHGSQSEWLRESVANNLRDWRFNTLGWNQEVVTRGVTNHRHSRPFTREDYQSLGMPYCHLLPFVDFHQWENETRHPDLFSAEWAEWCDHVAREHCALLADDPLLIGYFYVDCPTWVHIRPENSWKGPLFDPAKLLLPEGKQELSHLATQYYRVTHDAIRRYDPHHLILGDRYEANAPLPIEVVNAARPFVDVLSFQDFKDPVAHLQHWHQQTAMPVLWADGSGSIPTEQPGVSLNNGSWYARMLDALRENPGCVGAHLCGAYYRNRARKKGLLDEREHPDIPNINAIREANERTLDWVRVVQARSS